MIEFWQNETVAAAQKAATDAQAAARRAGTEALKKEWGGAYERRGKEIGSAADQVRRARISPKNSTRLTSSATTPSWPPSSAR